MPAKGTKETWLAKVLDRHPENADKYDYSLVEYKDAKTKVSIVCSKHGVFQQTPGHHLSRGHGCGKCADEVLSARQTSNTTEWLANVFERHPENAEKYDYSQVVYKNARTKVSIICLKHGVFQQTPDNHYKFGCNKCGHEVGASKQRFTTEQWIEAVLSRFPENRTKYDYSEVEYTKQTEKVKIICLEHGPIRQLAGIHLTGARPQCCSPTGFFPQFPAHYYVHKVMQGGKFVCYKAGVSGDWESRLQNLRNRLIYYGYTVEPVQQKYFESGAEAWEFEQEMLKKTDIRAPVLDIPGGNELFLQNPLEEE